MHQGSDYASQYYPSHYPTLNHNPNPNHNPSPIHNPNPTPMDFSQSSPIQSPFASAPPYSQYPQPEFLNCPSYSQIPPDPIPNLPPQPQFPHSHPFNPPPFPQEPYFPYDSAPIFAPNPNPNPYPYQSYENPYENSAKVDQGSGYLNDGSLSRYGFGNDDGLGDGVYAYDGGKVEPYGARGIGGFGMDSSSGSRDSGLKFDDYGRPLGKPAGSSVKEQMKIVRAVPKVEGQQDVKNGVQKYKVKLLPEGASVNMTDVLCQIGLDGIHMIDPSTNRMLRIYPLENVTRWEVLDSNIFAFWSKSPVDLEPRRIRLQSNSYTTSSILDTVTAATVQLKEMAGKDNHVRSKGNADASKPSDQTTEKKKGFADWMNLIKPGNEEKDHWVPDEAISKCTSCATDFGAFVRKHHCRNCGDIFCDKCTQGRIALTADEQAQPVRVCDRCMAEVSQRLSNARESTSKPIAIHSHEDLARKLQEEMEKNRKSSSVSKSSDGSGRRTREVACPICTVHLQVQVPTSGSETIECGVCQHPFLVSAH